MEKLLNIIYDVKEFRKQFPEVFKVLFGLLSILSLLFFASSVIDVFEESKKKEQIIAMWEEQLPPNHWIKNEPIGIFVTLIQKMDGLITTGVDLTTITVGQSSDVGSIIEILMEAEKGIWKSKYNLKYADTGRKVRNIKLKLGECEKVAFDYEGILQEFELAEKEFVEKGNLLVLSCVENKNIATIYDGKIMAHSKGKTVLYLYCDGEIWEYPIKVK